MTRKEAITVSIRVVEGCTLDQRIKDETIKMLNLCISELPFAKWSEAAIFDACDQFILDNKRQIRLIDFDRAGLPSHPTIKNRFKMSVKEFRDKYYPLSHESKNNSPYGVYTNEQIKDIFIKEYTAICPASGCDYNSRRSKSLPSWVTVAKRFGVSTWTQLINEFSLPHHSKRGATQRDNFKITATADNQTLLDMIRNS